MATTEHFLKQWVEMQIDLYNNHEAFVDERKQNWRLSPWLKKLGLKARDLTYHPCMDDLIILLDLHRELYNRMSWQEQKVWYGYWNIVYNHEFVLTKKFWNKFGRIVQAIDQRETRLQAHRDHLKSHRLRLI